MLDIDRINNNCMKRGRNDDQGVMRGVREKEEI